MGIFDNILFHFKRPKAVIIAGRGSHAAKDAVFFVLSGYFKIPGEIQIIETDFHDAQKIKSFLKVSPCSVFLMTHTADIPSDKYSFAGDISAFPEAEKVLNELPEKVKILLNSDDESVRALKSGALTFGFREESDLYPSDIVQNGKINFKMNWRGSSVPAWLEGGFGKEKIYAVLAAALCGLSFGLNLVQISQRLKEWKALS